MFSLFSFFKFLFPTCLVVKLAESATFLERGTVTSLGMSFVVSFVVPQGLWPRPWILAAWSIVMWWSSKGAGGTGCAALAALRRCGALPMATAGNVQHQGDGTGTC